MKLQHQLLRAVGYGAAIGICILLLIFVIGVTWIGFDVKTQCQQAQSEYGGDCVEALLGVVQDEHRGFRVRNYAIWALGQLGDGRAQPVLASMYTGVIPPREHLDKGISQYELRKAVDLTGGGTNILALFWRHGVGEAQQP